MSRLDEFLTPKEPQRPPGGVEWGAAVNCQVCNEPVNEQTLFPNESLLTWKCSAGHESRIENYLAF